jgi:hypothetical protein
VELEVALRNVNKPIGVANYRLQFPADELKELTSREMKENAEMSSKRKFNGYVDIILLSS